MVWFSDKDKNKNKNKDKLADEGTGKKNVAGQTKKNEVVVQGNFKSQQPGAKLSSEEIRAQALANARVAREAIGEETLQKIAAAIRKKQQSKMEQAKAKISKEDPSRVAEEILSMLDE